MTLATIASFGGLPWVLEIAVFIFLIIAFAKLTRLKHPWDELHHLKALVPLAFALLIGILNLQTYTVAGIAAYLLTGAGAMIVHDMLEIVKGVPGLGPSYINTIEYLSRKLGALPK